MEKKKNNRMIKAILETAEDMNKSGLMNDADYDKITMRHLGMKVKQENQPLTGKDIRALREKAQMSQAVFAYYLNLTPGYLSQLERDTKHPKGPVLALLNIIRRKGINVLL